MLSRSIKGAMSAIPVTPFIIIASILCMALLHKSKQELIGYLILAVGFIVAAGSAAFIIFKIRSNTHEHKKEGKINQHF